MQQLRESSSRRWTPAPGPRPQGWLAQASFAAEAGRIVDALSRMRLCVSIFVFRFDGLSPSRACALAEDALRGEGLVGRLPDRSLGLLRIADGAPAPDTLRAQLAGRLAARLDGTTQGIRVQVAERHGWTDEIDGVVDAIEELVDAPGVAVPLELPWRS